ncbi:MAG: hypothetical protein K0S74_104 [Chlamydiales bacterium]|jgi:hypothetical protein|nr:hypothetical protein [Chlamydiales bacterium]
MKKKIFTIFLLTIVLTTPWSTPIFCDRNDLVESHDVKVIMDVPKFVNCAAKVDQAFSTENTTFTPATISLSLRSNGAATLNVHSTNGGLHCKKADNTIPYKFSKQSLIQLAHRINQQATIALTDSSNNNHNADTNEYFFSGTYYGTTDYVIPFRGAIHELANVCNPEQIELQLELYPISGEGTLNPNLVPAGDYEDQLVFILKAD